jgi:uncharacterized integral membrane protein (TIGR00698 family)
MWEHFKSPESIRSIARFIASSEDFGIFLSITAFCGILAYGISVLDPAFDALFLALIFGILAGNVYLKENIKEIAEKSLVILLPLGITLYGANINIPYLGQFEPVIAISTFILASIMFISILWLSKVFTIKRKLSLLLACGSSICGVSAIAIISPLIRPKKEEFSAAIIIITAVGLTGAMLYPYIAYMVDLPAKSYALLTGATLHQTGLVKIASKFLGEDVMGAALSIKGIRIAMIALISLVISVLYSESRFYVPWYIVAFILIALFSNTYLPENLVNIIKPLATVVFSMTLAAIGFTVNIRDIQRVSMRPLIVAYLGWVITLGVYGVIVGSGVV